LDEDGIRTALQDLHHRQHVGLHDVLDRGDERQVRLQLLVPPAIFGAEGGADEHFVHRRIELDPGVALGEVRGVIRELLAEVRVLEVADPVGHAEVAQVHDRRDLAPLQLVQRQVGESQS
jgi:hypothetical protein